MEPGYTLTCEKAQAMLKGADGLGMPKAFQVDMTALDGDTYLVRWQDMSAEDRNSWAVSDPDDVNVAKAARKAEPERGFACVWFNENEEGAAEPTFHVLEKREIAGMSRSGSRYRIIDVRK